MRTIRYGLIKVADNRQRQEFDPEALQELKNSIEDRGLLHPIVLRPVGDQWYLVAGERRMRAIAEIFALGGSFTHDGVRYGGEWGDSLPYTSLGDLDPLEAEEAELDENLKRRDLTWQELAAAHTRLHSLRVKQTQLKNEAVDKLLPGHLLANQSHTVADTAKEVFGSSDGSRHDIIRKELIVSKHLDNPLVSKAKSVDEAFKILKKAEEAKKNVALAEEVGKTFNADLHQLFNDNCISWLERQPPEQFDVILTDPPYGMGAQDFGDGGGKLQGIEHRYDDSYEAWKILMTDWCGHSYRVAKPLAHAYVFCDIDNYHELKLFMQNAGWYVHRTPLIVHKINSGRVPLPDRGPRRQWEMILYAIKGNKPTTHIYPDVIPCQGDENTSHGAQKPVALYQNLLQRSVKPGDRVLDSFAGSGTIFEAAHGFKCQAVGIEMNPEYYGMCLKRIKGLKQLEQPALF